MAGTGPLVMLTAAITGGGPPRARVAWQPATTAETIAAALEVEAAGAAIIHLHARDDATGATTTDPAANAALRRADCRALLNLSAGDDGGRADHARRIALADRGAEMVTLAAGSFNAGARLYDNAPGFQRAQAAAISAAPRTRWHAPSASISARTWPARTWWWTTVLVPAARWARRMSPPRRRMAMRC